MLDQAGVTVQAHSLKRERFERIKRLSRRRTVIERFAVIPKKRKQRGPRACLRPNRVAKSRALRPAGGSLQYSVPASDSLPEPK